MTIVNNFRRINLSYKEKPKHLEKFFEYKEFIIYSSNFNQLLYIIYNPTDDTYFAFENKGSDDVKNDLIRNIKTYFK